MVGSSFFDVWLAESVVAPAGKSANAKTETAEATNWRRVMSFISGMALFLFCRIGRLCHRPDGANFDGAMVRSGATGRPGDSSVLVRSLDEVVAAELLLRVRVGAIENLRFAVADMDRVRSGDGSEAVGSDVGAGLLEGFAVGHIGGVSLLLLLGSHVVPTGFVRVEGQE